MGCLSCAASMYERLGMVLTRRESSAVPVDGSSISPDRFLGLGAREIASLPAAYGREEVTLGDLFDVEGVAPESIVVDGDVAAVRNIGRGMTRGEVLVTGDVGPHTGAGMKGGEIRVQGSAGDWLGAHIAGGRIVVDGDGAAFVGAAHTGERHGASGGLILVQGSVGRECATSMRRGLMVVLGGAGEFAGAGMDGGTLVVAGGLGGDAGRGMRRGSIVALGGVAGVSAGFAYCSTYRPVFLRYYATRLAEWGLLGAAAVAEGVFRRYMGDGDVAGRGEILVRDESE